MMVITSHFLQQTDDSFPEMNSIKNRDDFETFVFHLTSRIDSFNLGKVFRSEIDQQILVLIFFDCVEDLPTEYFYKDFISDLEELPEKTRKTIEMMLEKVKKEQKDMTFLLVDL